MYAFPSSGWNVKILMSYELYGLFGMSSIRIVSVHYVLVHVSDCNSADSAHA